MKKFLTALLVLSMLAVPCYASAVSRTLLSAVATTGASDGWNCSQMETKTIYIIATDATTGGTVAVEKSYDNSTWIAVATEAVTTGIKEIAIVGLFQRYIRANITARTDGTYTIYLFGKQ